MVETSMMNIVRTFEIENPDILTQFEGYRHKIKKITSQEIDNCRVMIDNYLKVHLKDSIFKYKIYSYKFFDDVKIEVLIKPTETANIVEYHLIVGPRNLRIERIR